MLISLLRRILIYLSTVSLTAILLVLVQTVHLGEAPTWKMGLGVVAALAALLPSWIAIVKTEDYLIPAHTRRFLLVTATLSAIVGAGLLAYFTLADYSQTYFLYFGAAPAGLALLYVGIALLRAREAHGLPTHYRPDPNPVRYGLLSAILSIPVLALAGFLLLLVVREVDFGAHAKTVWNVRQPSETSRAVDTERRAADLFEEAKALQADGQYRESFELFRSAADLGHTAARYELGRIYGGEGYHRNLRLAVEQFEKAHAEGDLASAYELGKIYRHGAGVVESDFEKARTYLTAAAEGGHAAAAFELGQLYHRGQGVEKDPGAAFHWLLKAAEQGHPVAQNDVGIFYLNGTGVEVDTTEAFHWIAKAAEQGITVAQYNYGQALYSGEVVARDYEKAFACFQELAKKEIPLGFRMIGTQYLLGQGVERDPEAAFNAFREGARRNDPASLYHFGRCHLEGVGTPADSTLGLRYLNAAAARDYGEAQFLLGEIYLAGEIILRDKAAAAEFFRAAAKNGIAEAEEALAALEATLTPEERLEADERLSTGQS